MKWFKRILIVLPIIALVAFTFMHRPKQSVNANKEESLKDVSEETFMSSDYEVITTAAACRVANVANQ